jgi:hypothetical protein
MPTPAEKVYDFCKGKNDRGSMFEKTQPVDKAFL